ncbi:MAG: hypothetical protein WBR26_03505 [Candidatus Acidiferrum sp.]
MLHRIGDGYFAEVQVSGYSLRLSCVETGAGIASNVYSRKDERWADTPSWFHSFDEAMNATTTRARVLLYAIGKLSLPNVEWKPISGDSR